MSGCPSGRTGKDCGCDSGLESEWECDPCSRGQCREWQRTPNFPRSLPGRHLDASGQPIVRNVRIVFGSTLGTILVGGWMYHKYMSYVADKEAAKARKAARAKPKHVKHEHLGIVAPAAALLPDVKKEVVNVKTKREVGTVNEGPKEMKNEPMEVVAAAASVPDVKKEELGKVETETEIRPVSEEHKELTNNPVMVVSPAAALVPEVKKEFGKVNAKSDVRSINGGSKGVKNTPLRVGNPAAASASEVKKELGTSLAQREVRPVSEGPKIPKIVKNKAPRVNTPASASVPVPDVKKNSAKIETKNAAGATSEGPKAVDNKRLGVVAPAAAFAPEAKTKLGNAGAKSRVESNGGAQEGVKKETGEEVVFTVFTQGKKGKNVKRRGWK